MQKCTHCNIIYPDSAKYCNKCGRKLIDECTQNPQNNPLPLGELFSKEDEDFCEYKRGFAF